MPFCAIFFESAVAAGCPADALIDAIGEGPDPFRNPNRRMPNESFLRMLHRGVEVTGESSLPIRGGINFRPESTVYMALIHAPTLRAAIKIFIQYEPLYQHIGAMTLQEKDGKATVFWRTYIDDPEYLAPFSEAAIAAWVVFGRWISWMHKGRLRSVSFRHARPPHGDFIDELFGCETDFNAPRDELRLDSHVLDLALPKTNPRAHQLLVAALAEDLATYETRTMARDLYTYFKYNLAGGAVDMESAAEALEVSGRTMRRRLQQENTTFRDVLEKTRKEVCEVMLAQQEQSMAQIAQLLGFSEQSAFTRAFRRWHGKSPSQYERG